MATQAQTVVTLAQGQSKLESMFTQFMQAQIRKGSNNGSNDSGSTPPASSSSPASPAGPTPLASPATMAMVQEHEAKAGIPISYVLDDVIAEKRKEAEVKFEAKIAREAASPPEITPVKPYKGKLDTDTIITADLEAMILPDGSNKIYMAAWYNGKESKIFDLTQYGLSSDEMLADFWLDLINHNQGSILYFHNWAGYDAILSLLPLVGLHEHGLTFEPIIQNNQVLSLTVFQEIQGKNKKVLTIKDSLKMIPGALGRLAKDFQVATQKDHFPHYFLLNEDVAQTLSYIGPLPDYEFFEPKRTSRDDYADMVKEFKGKDWNYLDISRKYILGDVEAQYQILIKYFNTLRDAFPINPLGLISAFKIWRTVQLPILNKDLLKSMIYLDLWMLNSGEHIVGALWTYIALTLWIKRPPTKVSSVFYSYFSETKTLIKI